MSDAIKIQTHSERLALEALHKIANLDVKCVRNDLKRLNRDVALTALNFSDTAAAFISIAVAEDSKRKIPICFCEARAARLQTCLRRLDLPTIILARRGTTDEKQPDPAADIHG